MNLFNFQSFIVMFNGKKYQLNIKILDLFYFKVYNKNFFRLKK